MERLRAGKLNNLVTVVAYGIAQIPPIPFFSKEEEDYLVQEFSVQGYRNSAS